MPQGTDSAPKQVGNFLGRSSYLTVMPILSTVILIPSIKIKAKMDATNSNPLTK